MRRRTLLAAGGASLVAAPLAFAKDKKTGQGDAKSLDSGFSAPTAAPHLTPEEAVAFAKQVEKDLAAKQARLALVFRTGRPRDKLPPGISYTHGAFWAFGPITLADGRKIDGYAVYNLYHGDGAKLPKTQSYLQQDFPVDFVRGSAVDDVAVIVPSPEMQRRILKVMASPAYQKLHVPTYSLISNATDPKYQNCNEFMLDVIGAAAWDTTDYAQIKANLAQHFRGSRVKVGGFQRLIGPIADSRLKTDDHKGGKIETATYESMSAFMRDMKLLQESYVLERA